jgi:serine/threonine-protein kinase
MATVYVGRQTGAAGFERLVAIKCCHEHLRLNEAFVSMFLQEARLAARIRHPNVVATLDVSPGVPLYLVMEFVEGLSLSALARRVAARGERLRRDVALRIVTDALAGLGAAHQCRGPDGQLLDLVHCDVSPQNILVGVDGTSRITDFGIARAAAKITDTHETEPIKGKLRYMAPEQLLSRPVTPTTDLFAAGIVLWELLTGQPLFRADNDAATMRAVLLRSIPPPSALAPYIPKELDAVVMRALERDPSARFQTAEDFLSSLEKIAVAVATARTVGECVREHGGAPAVEWESGSFRSSGAQPRTVSPAAPRPAEQPFQLPIHVEEATADPPTTFFETPKALIAATSVGPEAPDVTLDVTLDVTPDVTRVRRLVVALVLLLLGCALGLIVATSSSRPANDPGATSAEPARGP